MKYKGYTAMIEYSEEDSIFFGVVQGINDLVSFDGSTVEELKMAFEETVDDYLDLCKRNGREPDKVYSGSFNVRVGSELHKKVAMKAAREKITLNKCVENALVEAIDEPQKVQVVVMVATKEQEKQYTYSDSKAHMQKNSTRRITPYTINS